MGIRTAWRELWKGNPRTIKKRGFAGAKLDRLTSGWVRTTNSADSALKGDLKRLRNGSRQLVNDVDYCKQAVRNIVDNIVGTGVKLQSQVRMQRGGKLDTKMNSTVEKNFKHWGYKDSCDVAGRLCFDDITRLAVHSMVQDGECFIRIIRGKKFGRSTVPLALEVLEADMCDLDYTGKSTNKNQEWRMGVLVNEWQRPIKYAFFSRHPGDSLFIQSPTTKDKHVLVDAKDVIHLYRIERPGQTRGIPWMSSSLNRMHHIEGYEEAEVVRARLGSSLMAYITSPEGELSGDEVVDDDRVFDMSPGAIRYLAPGETVNVPTFDAPDGQFEPFLRAMLRALAAGIGCSYESISRDYSQTNYSSSRLSLLQDHEAFKALQYQLRENFLSIVFEEWLEAAVLSGTLQLPTYLDEPNKYKMVKWLFRGWGWVDPMKEVQSAKEAIRAGLKTQSQVIAEMGGDLEELLMTRKNEIDMAAELGLEFDTEVKANTQESSNIEPTPNENYEQA